MIYVLKNPWFGNIDLCYSIGANDGSIGASLNTHYVNVMFQLKNGKLLVDPNWNAEELLILNGEIDFLEEINTYWGYGEGNLRFYGTP